MSIHFTRPMMNPYFSPDDQIHFHANRWCKGGRPWEENKKLFLRIERQNLSSEDGVWVAQTGTSSQDWSSSLSQDKILDKISSQILKKIFSQILVVYLSVCHLFHQTANLSVDRSLDIGFQNKTWKSTTFDQIFTCAHFCVNPFCRKSLQNNTKSTTYIIHVIHYIRLEV